MNEHLEPGWSMTPAEKNRALKALEEGRYVDFEECMASVLVREKQSPQLKRYALFVGAHYYPRRGFDDYVHSFPTLEEAQEVAEELLARAFDDFVDDIDSALDWAQVVDLSTGDIVFEGDKKWPPK